MSVEGSDAKFLQSAQGFLDLGLHLEANSELERIDPYLRAAPEVLTLRVDIYRKLEKWELMEVVAKKLSEFDRYSAEWPLAWAEAASRARSVDAGRTILVDAVERFPMVAMVH